MKLTTFTDYSLRALIYLALNEGERATIARIARAYGISEAHLVKVVHFLSQAGWVNSIRGKGGGLELGRAPDALNLGEIVRLTEGADRPAECFDPNSPACCIDGVCRLRGALGEAVGAFYATLDRYSLADLVDNAPVLRERLDLPRR
jgi:Rrf2 family nitric oxide-sensitive transcriptional repressor